MQQNQNNIIINNNINSELKADSHLINLSESYSKKTLNNNKLKKDGKSYSLINL